MRDSWVLQGRLFTGNGWKPCNKNHRQNSPYNCAGETTGTPAAVSAPPTDEEAENTVRSLMKKVSRDPKMGFWQLNRRLNSTDGDKAQQASTWVAEIDRRLNEIYPNLETQLVWASFMDSIMSQQRASQSEKKR